MFLKIWKMLTASKKNAKQPSDVHDKEVKVTIKTETGHSYVDRLLARNEGIPLVDLDGYICPSGGFVNWATYEVVGKNINTNRKNKRRYDAKSEDHAIKQAETDGLTGPYNIVAIKHEDPSDNQIQYLRSWGVSVPIGASKADASAILSRLEDETETVSEKKVSHNTTEERVRLLPGPTPDFARFADGMGIRFSRYIGKAALFDKTIYGLDGRDRIAFYAYCIICSQKKTEIGDLRKSEYFDRLYTFADTAAKDPPLLRSIEGRSANDYLNPHKGSVAYKAVAEYFDIK